MSRLERAVGIFLLVVTALLATAVLSSGHTAQLIEFFREGFVVYALADEGHGVVVGSPVKVRGVEVGSVKKLELVEGPPGAPNRNVRLTIRVTSRAAQFLGEKTVAMIIEPPLGSGMPPFGTASVELRSAGDGRLANRAVIMAEGEESMVDTMAKMGHDVSAMRDQLTKTIEEMGTTFANMRKLTESMVDGKGIAGRMLTDQALAGELESMVKDARATTGDARRLMVELSRVTTQVEPVVHDAREVSAQSKKMMGKVDAALDALPRLVASTERSLAAAEELLATLKTTAGYAPELARKVDVSLDETSRLVEAAQRNFILRSTLPDRPTLRTESAVRPPMPLPAKSAP